MAELGKDKHSSVQKANQGIADKVNESLPLKINADDVEKTPEFVKLLKVLSHRLNEEGISKPVKRSATEAEKTLKHEKQFWLQYQILHEELGEMLIDNQLNALANKATDADNQFYEAVNDCLLTAEIGDFLEPNPETQTTLLGLKKEDLARRNPHVKHMSAIQQKLIPEVEDRLRQKCETLVSFHDSSDTTDSSKLAFAKASQLPAMLEAEKRELREHRCNLRLDRAGHEKQFWQYYNALVSSLEVLQTLILNHRLKLQTQCDTTTSEWLTARCDAMCLKIKVLELQLMSDTYNPNTVRALNIIKKEVSSATNKTKSDISAASNALKAYESVSAGFDALVQEYNYVKGDIENKKWALRELKQDMNK